MEKANVDYVRPVATLEQISQALALMEKKPESLSKDYYLRRKEIISAIQNVSLEMKACMIRDLNGRKQDKGLNITEGDVFLQLKKNFLVEWAIVSGEEKNLLESKLSEALHTGPPKYSHA
jgi:RNA polymerase-interacting CarD/CdnL/TRCF family regulator